MQQQSSTEQRPTVEHALYLAVQHALEQIQENPDVGYFCGFGTQTFFLLVRAEAAYLKKPVADVETERRKDKQPHYRRRAPEVLVLRDLVRKAQDDGFELDRGAVERRLVEERS